MAELRDLVGPAAAVNFCRLLGLGLRWPDSGVGRRVADALLLAANAVLCAYGYAHVTHVVSERMPQLWDATTVMSVVRVYAYLIAPAVEVAAWQWHGRAVVEAVRELDDAMPRGGIVAATPLWPCARHAATWCALSLLLEWTTYTLFHVGTGFAYFTPHEYVLIAVYNVWATVPVSAYVTIVTAVRLGVRRVNGRATTVAAWRAHRDSWMRLARAAVRLARREFGITLVAFLVYNITEVVFFVFSVHFTGYPSKGFMERRVYPTMFVANAAFRAARIFHVFRASQNCQAEILKTQKILSFINVKTRSDFRDIQYFSLYMLHTDFDFVPCNIFKMNYRNLLKIATMITAFTVFQIQMKL